MARIAGRWSWLVALVLLASCERKPENAAPADAGAPAVDASTAPAKKKPKIVKDDGPMPTDDTPIATAGDFTVTVGDFDEASAVSLLFAPDGQTDLPPERLALPHVHITMSRSLLSQKVVDAEVARRGLEPTREQIEAFLRDHERLGRFGKYVDDPEALAKSLKPLGLKPEQLFDVARAELSNRVLARALVADVSDDDIWQRYRFDHTTRTAAIVEGRNIPTSEEIDTWMGDHAREIDDHFQKNQGHYRVPRRVKLNMVRPAPGQKVSDDVLEKASKMLLKGIQPKTVAKELGLEFELDAQLVRGENPKAFAMQPGEGGWTNKGARGAYAWKVTGFEASALPEMTRPLRREIAAELLRTTSVVDSLAGKLERASESLRKAKFDAYSTERLSDDPALTADLLSEVEAIDGLEFLVATFPNDPRRPLPKFGLAEEVVSEAFGARVGATTDPFLSRERGFLLRVLGAHTPTRKEFDAHIDENRKAFVDATEPRIVSQWVEQRLSELGAKLDVKPLRIKYGVLQKE